MNPESIIRCSIPVVVSAKKVNNLTITEWLQCHIEPNSYIHEFELVFGYPYLGVRIWFENERDATLFALVWA